MFFREKWELWGLRMRVINELTVHVGRNYIASARQAHGQEDSRKRRIGIHTAGVYLLVP